jgi:enterochelin esterase-like enzyme
MKIKKPAYPLIIELENAHDIMTFKAIGKIIELAIRSGQIENECLTHVGNIQTNWRAKTYMGIELGHIFDSSKKLENL